MTSLSAAIVAVTAVRIAVIGWWSRTRRSGVDKAFDFRDARSELIVSPVWRCYRMKMRWAQWCCSNRLRRLIGNSVVVKSTNRHSMTFGAGSSCISSLPKLGWPQPSHTCTPRHGQIHKTDKTVMQLETSTDDDTAGMDYALTRCAHSSASGRR